MGQDFPYYKVLGGGGQIKEGAVVIIWGKIKSRERRARAEEAQRGCISFRKGVVGSGKVESGKHL